MVTLTIELLADTLSVCRLPATAELPAWATGTPFCSVTRTADELSIICPTDRVPADMPLGLRDDGWRAMKLVGPFAFTEIGILLRIAAPLTEAEVSMLSIATFDTDYVLIRVTQRNVAIEALRAAGHVVRE